MTVSRDAEVGPPSYEDFEVVKEAVLCLAENEFTQRRLLDNGNTLFIRAEQLYADMDFLAWPLLTICISGLLKTFPGGNKVTIRYRELAHNSATENSSVNHDYIFQTQDGELIEFGQTIRACPELREPRIESPEIYGSDTLLDQAEEGRHILMQNTGTQLEVSAGDCAVLFDRLLQFVLDQS